MNMQLLTLVSILLSVLTTACGYKLLCVFPVPSRSHGALAKGMVNALLNAGHQVTWATPFPDWITHDNLTVIHLDTMVLFQATKDISTSKKEIFLVQEFARQISSITYKTDSLQRAVVYEQFDAVVTEWFFSDTDAGIAAVQQVPWIQLSPTIMNPHHENVIDDVRSISTVPLIVNDCAIPMTLPQRLFNSALFAALWAMAWLNYNPTAARYEGFFAPMAAARGVTLPPFMSALYNISILFVNSDPTYAPALSLPPNVVDIGGFHIKEEVPALPQDLKHIMDSSTGVVYFSMGSVLTCDSFPENVKRIIIEALRGIPYTVLWKCEEDLDVSSNVHLRNWWPQDSILAHPNTKLFITHGGLLSNIEAIHFGVPLLVIPVFGDQPGNANRAARDGYAIRVQYHPDMGQEFKMALGELLTNHSYYNKAKHLSKLFRKRPMAPSKLISHYVELAIESKGAFHLRSKTHYYPWYQRWMLDQLAVVVVLFYALYKIVRKLCTVCSHCLIKEKIKTN